MHSHSPAPREVRATISDAERATHFGFFSGARAFFSDLRGSHGADSPSALHE